MAQKSKSVYICSECGYETPRWLGQCPGCNEWNTLNEEIITVTKEKLTRHLLLLREILLPCRQLQLINVHRQKPEHICQNLVSQMETARS